MTRFYIISTLLHFGFFATIFLTGQTSFKPTPKFEVYKVSLAPLPQPKILGTENLDSETPQTPEKKVIETRKPDEKAAPEAKTTPKKESAPKTDSKTPAKETKKKGLPDGLPDIKPQIYTGSGRGFNYSYYLNILLSKIGQNWNNPFRNQDVVLKNVVYFEVDKDGKISNIRLEDDSGDEIYNESTMRAVALAKKLPPLPQEFVTDYLKVHLEFLSGE